ncbi:MAG: hypothetical protein AAGI28_01520 [Pseudomonadota bacterium]
MMRFATIALFAACVALACTEPASAQFESTFPDTPPERGQTLLDWADPPILKHTIPESQRSDTSTCGSTSEYDLDQTAVACWPVLRAAQLFLVADYATQEPTGNTLENKRNAITLADEAIAFIGKPEWPLEEYLLIKSLELKLNAQINLENWQPARETGEQLIVTLKNDLYRFDEFRLSFAYHKLGEVLLQLDEWDRARALLEEARLNLKGFDGEKNAMRFSDQSEDMVIRAINRGELHYAEEMARRYFDFASTIDSRRAFGFETHIDLLLYLAARKGDRNEALDLLDQRFAQQSSYSPCRTWQFDFPRMLGALVEDADIANTLIDGGCTKDQLDTQPSQPIQGSRGKTLPPLGG